MESFIKFKTNLEFANMIRQESKTQRALQEAANKSFDAIIKATLSPNESKVQGRYSLQKNSFKLTIDKRDQVAFKKLFKTAPDKTVGNGEVSLYWLFNGGSNTAKETRGGNDPDLMINRQAVEVKAYPYHDPISLGRFQDRRAFRAMVNTLFGVANLENAFGGGEGRGQQTFKGELSFKYQDLLESAESFLNLKSVIDGNNKALMKFPIFKQMQKTIASFENSLKAIDYNERKVTANGIAIALMKHLIKVSVGDKPGDKGYIANLKDKDPLDIYFHYIDFDNMTTDERVLKQKGTFSINGGVFKANFGRLFG